MRHDRGATKGFGERITAVVRSEARILFAALKTIGGTPLAPVNDKPGWRRFGAMGTSAYGHAVTMLLLLIVVEAPAVHLILGAVMEDSALRELIRGLLIGSSLYLGLWLVGDLRLLRETGGVWLGSDVLMIELGVRVHGEVSLELVTGAQSLVAAGDARVAGSRIIRVTPLPSPNCRIRLSTRVCLRAMFGIPIRGEVLDVYVDDPAALASSIEAAIASRALRRRT